MSLSTCDCVYECGKAQRSTARSPNRAESQTTYRSNEGGNEKVIFTNFSELCSHSVWLWAPSASLWATSAKTRHAYATEKWGEVDSGGGRRKERQSKVNKRTDVMLENGVKMLPRLLIPLIHNIKYSYTQSCSIFGLLGKANDNLTRVLASCTSVTLFLQN